jgi:hypothetical protein
MFFISHLMLLLRAIEIPHMVNMTVTVLLIVLYNDEFLFCVLVHCHAENVELFYL